MEGGALQDPDYCLSDSDVKRVAGSTGLLIIRYPELSRFATWDEFMQNQARAAAVLFLVQGPTSGHWIAAFDGPDATAQVWDPLGMPLDSQRNELSASKRNALGENEAQFARLLATAEAAGKRPCINHVEFQEFSPSINTCGRWVGLRILHRDKTDTQFKAFVLGKVKAAGMRSPDEWVTQYTNPKLSGGGPSGTRRPEDDSPWLDDVSALMGGRMTTAAPRLTGGVVTRVGYRASEVRRWASLFSGYFTNVPHAVDEIVLRARAVSPGMEHFIKDLKAREGDAGGHTQTIRGLIKAYVDCTATAFEEAFIKTYIHTFAADEKDHINAMRLRTLQEVPAAEIHAAAFEREREQDEQFGQLVRASREMGEALDAHNAREPGPEMARPVEHRTDIISKDMTYPPHGGGMPGMAGGRMGRIYKIVSPRTKKVYVGSTFGDLAERLSRHKSLYKSHKAGKFHYVTSMDITRHPDARIVLLEERPVKNVTELLLMEGKWQRRHSARLCNKCMHGGCMPRGCFEPDGHCNGCGAKLEGAGMRGVAGAGFDDMDGAGFFDDIGSAFRNVWSSVSGAVKEGVSRVKNFASGARLDYPPSAARALAEYSSWTVKELTLRRQAVGQPLNTVLDTVSLGTFSKATQEAGLSTLYHLGLACLVHSPATGDVITVLVEKNAVINIARTGAVPQQEQSVPTPDPPVTFGEFMQRARAAAGDERFFKYSAFGNNCQDFVRGILSANGVLTSAADAFLKQNVEGVRSKIAPHTEAVANTLTDLGARFDRLIQGGSDEPAAAGTKRKRQGGSAQLAMRPYLRTKLPGDYALADAKLPVTIYSSETERKVVAVLPPGITLQSAAACLQRARRFVRSATKFEYTAVGAAEQSDLLHALRAAGLVAHASVVKPGIIVVCAGGALEQVGS